MVSPGQLDASGPSSPWYLAACQSRYTLVIKERGVPTPKGLWVLGAILFQAAAIFITAHSGSVAMAEGLIASFIDKRLTAWTTLPSTAVFAFGGALAFVLVRLSITRQSVAHGFF
ncbi:MAG TPA: hypothetical protein VJV04_16790 [Nitrospiraceae bacterium]|nr:hypothetical protein [Nitrospiraceae bacterium]